MGAYYSTLVIAGFGTGLLMIGAGSAISQSPPPFDEIEPPPVLPDPTKETIPTPPELLVPTPLPEPDIPLEFPDPGPPPAEALPENFQFWVNRIEVTGNTVLKEEIATLTSRHLQE